MNYKIIADSCCEFPKGYEKDPAYARIPLRLEVGPDVFIDDEGFDQKLFLEKVAAWPESPKSSCPSPETFKQAYRTDAENVFVFTLSSKLSGSYNSAELGKKMYHDEYGEKNIFVCDSESASCGETQLAFKAAEWSKQGLAFEEICRRLRDYRDKMKTYFVLDNLETLRKNGRLSEVKSMVAQTLNIKPVMSAKGGIIIQKSQAIGMKKALMKIRDYMLKEVAELNERRIVITHCNCPDRAEYLKGLLKEKARLKEVVIMDTAGVSSMYANDGGIIVTA